MTCARFRKQTVIALAILVLAVIPAAAKEVTLTKDSLSRFLASVPDVRAELVTHGVKAVSEASNSPDAAAALLKALADSQLPAQANRIVQRHGFANVKEWLETANAVREAYTYLVTAPKDDAARQKQEKRKAAALREIDKLGFLTDRQKERLKAHANKLAKEPPAENLALVKEMRGSIEAALALK